MNLDNQDPQSGPPEPVADPAVPDPGATAPTFDWDADENPWKQRFEGYRPEADRKITRLSQFEQAVQDFQTGDPSEMRRAAAILGIADHLDIEEPEPPVYDDPVEELRAQLAAQDEKYTALEGKLTKREQAEQEAQQVAEINKRLDKLSITDEVERNMVLGTAFTLPMGDDGLPDIPAAIARIEARDKARDRAWASGKRAPRSIQPGQTATQTRNISEMVDSTGLLTQEGLDYLAQQAEGASQV
jgi:hypothetical protein